LGQRRNENDPDNKDASHAGDAGTNENNDNPELLGPAKDLARLAQIQAQMQNYGGVPQRLEAGIAAWQAGLSGSALDDLGTQPARERLARAQSALAEWKQTHPDYTALSREQAAIQASVRAQQDAQDQSDAGIKASLAMPETVRMNGALPPDPMPALGPGDVSLSDVQQRAGDLAGQMQIAPSAALRAALVEAKNGGATTVGGADITAAIRNTRPAPWPSPDLATLRDTTSSVPNPWDLRAVAQEAWGRAKDFGAAVEQGLTRPIAGVLGTIAVGDHLLTGAPVNDTGFKQFADAINDYWNEARNPDYADSTLSKAAGAIAPIIPTLLVTRFGGGPASAIFNAVSMGGEAMLEAKEKGCTDNEAMEMSAVNLGFGAVGGSVISRSLNRINALTNGSLSKYILSLAKANAPALIPAARAGLAAGQSALEGGLFGAAQSFGSEAWAKLRNLGDAGQREWSAIWNDAKTAGVQNALTMALTTIFAAGAVPPAQRRQIADQAETDAPPPSPPPTNPLTSPKNPSPTTERSSPTTENFSPTPENLAPTPENSAPPPAASEPASENAKEAQGTSEPKEDNSPSDPATPTAPTDDPLAQRVADLHDQATTLRDKITAAQDAGSPEAIGDLATNLDAEKDTQAQFHQATQDLLDTVPENLRTRIERGTAPGLDHEAIRARNSEDPAHSFATSEIGNALRDEYLPDLIQRQIRKKAQVLGVDPALAERIADQTIGAKAVSDLETVLRGGSIEPGNARILKQIGLLKPARMPDGTRRLAITDDVLPLLSKSEQDAVASNPKAFRVVHTKGPPADGLNRLVDGGRQRFADTAKYTQAQAPITPPPLGPKKSVELRERLLGALRFQVHHIISITNSATKDHPLLKLAGFDLDSRSNKMWLPYNAKLYPSRSIHKGKHLQSVSDNLRQKMDSTVKMGRNAGWTRNNYAEALKSIIAEERTLLKSGNRRLNKNARPYAQ